MIYHIHTYATVSNACLLELRWIIFADVNWARYSAADRLLTVIEKDGHYTCSYCGRSFALKGTCSKHLAMHLGKTTCSICYHSFSSPGNLKKHLKTIHKQQLLWAALYLRLPRWMKTENRPIDPQNPRGPNTTSLFKQHFKLRPKPARRNHLSFCRFVFCRCRLASPTCYAWKGRPLLLQCVWSHLFIQAGLQAASRKPHWKNHVPHVQAQFFQSVLLEKTLRKNPRPTAGVERKMMQWYIKCRLDFVYGHLFYFLTFNRRSMDAK
jgi:hypothetical protein